GFGPPPSIHPQPATAPSGLGGNAAALPTMPNVPAQQQDSPLVAVPSNGDPAHESVDPISGPPDEAAPQPLPLSLEHGDREGGHTVRDQVTEWLDALVWLDEDRVDSLRLMVSELVVNGVDHSEGRVEVTAHQGGGGPGERALRIAVADGSRGVPASG